MQRQSWLKVKVKPAEGAQAFDKVKEEYPAAVEGTGIYRGVTNDYEKASIGINPDPEAAAFGKAN